MHLPLRSFLLLALGLPSALAAQETHFQVYNDRVQFTSRGTLAGAAGTILQEVPGRYFMGVGDVGTVCFASAAYYTTQDQDRATPETYWVVVRNQNPAAAGPDPSPAGLLVEVGPLTLPTDPAGGVVTYTMSDSFSPPLALPCTGGFYMGLRLSANAGWATDGQSMHMAFYRQPPGAPAGGDNPRDGAPDLAWEITDLGVVLQPTHPTGHGRVWRFGLMLRSPNLNMGNHYPVPDPWPSDPAWNMTSYGAGGIFPWINLPAPGRPTATATDGLRARVRDNTNVGGGAVVFLATGAGPGIPIPGISGRLWLDPGGLLPTTWSGTPITSVVGIAPGGTALGSVQGLVIDIAPPGAIPPLPPNATVFFQALTFDASFGNFWFTNLAAVSLTP